MTASAHPRKPAAKRFGEHLPPDAVLTPHERFGDEVLVSMYTVHVSRHLLTTPGGQRILARLRTLGPFLEGSLTVTTKRCGRATCRCVTEGPIHGVALLTWKEQGTTRTLHVPIALREEVAAWVEEGKRLKQLIHAMSAAQREFLLAQRRRHARARRGR